MPITIVLPADGDPFGVGFYIIADETGAGPWPVDTEWLIHIQQAEPGVQTAWTWRMPWNSGHLNGIVGRPPQSLRIPWQSSIVKPGETARVTLEAWSETFGLQDSTDRAIVYDPTSGAPFILQEQIQESGGMTTEQATQLEEVHQASFAAFPTGALAPIADLIQQIAPRLLVREAISPDRTGEGQLQRPVSGVPVAAHGLGFDVITVPDFIGTVEGNPDRYARVVLQLVLVANDNSGGFYLREQSSYDIGAQQFLFDPRGAQHIQYYIPPGVVIRFYWLVWGF